MFKHYQRRSNSIVPMTNNRDNLLSLEEILSKQRKHIDGKVFILMPLKPNEQSSEGQNKLDLTPELRKSSGLEIP